MKKILNLLLILSLFLVGCCSPKQSKIISPKNHLIDYVLETSILQVDDKIFDDKDIKLVNVEVNSILEDTKTGKISNKIKKYFETNIKPLSDKEETDIGMFVSLHHQKIKINHKKYKNYNKDLTLASLVPSEKDNKYAFKHKEQSFLTVFVISFVDLNSKKVLYSNTITSLNFNANDIIYKEKN